MDALGTPSGKDYLLAGLIACLLVAVPISALIFSKWVFLGAGLIAGIFWAWIRFQTGVWVDNFDDVKISIVSGPKGSQQQSPER